MSAYGGVGRRLERLLAGDRVLVGGRITPFAGGDRARWVSRHVRSRVTLQFVGDTATPAPLARAANRVRPPARPRATRRWPAGDRALFLGLVIGDDRDQPDALVQAFRDAGLSHLTAVSGQNVAFVLVAATPLLRRLRPRGRFVATVAPVIGWFAALTRFEPSVIRASGMAALAAATVLARLAGRARSGCSRSPSPGSR